MKATQAKAKQAIVFLTHIVSSKIHNHFARLKSQTQDIADAYLCVHKPFVHCDAGPFFPDFMLSRRDERRVLPNRFAQKERRGLSIVPGFADLAYMPALVSAKLADYRYIWMVEYDVEFSGNWETFFSALLSSDADLLGTTFYPRAQCPDWYHWPSFQTPPEVLSTHHVRSFLPIVRFSRRMIDCYIDAVRDARWRGHHEALCPTIALHNALKIEDLGGSGPFTPASLRERHYCNNPAAETLRPGTLAFRPVEHTAYFPDAPDQFPLRGFLYHPVKVHKEIIPQHGILARVSNQLRKIAID